MELPGGHREYQAACALHSRLSGQFHGSGLGSASTMESRHRYRQGRICPSCGAGAIIRSKPEYGGGWYCLPLKGGCRASFNQGDPEIEGQKPENPDPADQYNTVLKMACKRALASAVLAALAAAEVFTPATEPGGAASGNGRPAGPPPGHEPMDGGPPEPGKGMEAERPEQRDNAPAWTRWPGPAASLR
jgi:hypothetical protein